MITTSKHLAGLCRISLILLTALAVRAEGPSSNLASFAEEIRPLLREYCLKCHSTEKHKGDLDLEQFSSLDTVKRHSKIWQRVAEQLANNEMPPKEKPQPTPAEKEKLAQWVNGILDEVARSRAGDPGPVVLRRLSNVEYTYTIRDLTGVELDPAREFPGDSAAGEGFMNTGQSLVMSPALLTKYFDAAKEIASHAVLLPDGIRFSPRTTRRDWTDEVLAQIKAFYGEFADGEGHIPLEKYLAATLAIRDAKGARQVEDIAKQQGLNAKYLSALWNAFSSAEDSPLLGPLRNEWQNARSGETAGLAATIDKWQKDLWKFQKVGHMKQWQVEANPIVTKQEFRFKIPTGGDARDVTVYLAAGTAGDGNTNDFVVWQKPRLVTPGRPNLLLRDLRDFTQAMTAKRERVFSATAKALRAASEADSDKAERAELAKRVGIDLDALAAWFDFLGIGSSSPVKITSYYTNTMASASGYDFIKGWGSSETPSIIANSSDEQVRIPGIMKPHSVTLHPSPTLNSAAGWRSPITASMRVEGNIKHAHPECGNGITWSLELRRGATRQPLGSGTINTGGSAKIGPIEKLAVQKGDLISVLIGPRDANHSCDLTAVDFTLTSEEDSSRKWDLASDVSSDILAGNPHADKQGNDAVWHFYFEPVKEGAEGPIIPAGSLLARWQSAGSSEEKQQLAEELQKLLTSGAPEKKDAPDAKLYRQLASLGGPLFAGSTLGTQLSGGKSQDPAKTVEWGLPSSAFGRHPSESLDPADICVQAPSAIEIHLPADLVAGCELVTTGLLHPQSGAEGSVQLAVTTKKPGDLLALSPEMEVLANEGSAARKKFERLFADFRRLFPAAICYSRIVPVDEVITLTLFHREDDHLCRLFLTDAQKARLDRLWEELHYISQDALTVVDAFAQLMEYATQDSDPKLFEPFRKPINERAAAFRQLLVDTEPRHLEALLDFATRAYRRPLTTTETGELRNLYASLRKEELPHAEAFRLTLARVLVSPAFLYRLEKPGPGKEPAAVSDAELASRLGYFLWSSMPDAELNHLAAESRLHEPDVLVAQARRMLRDPKARRLAIEFACQWLHIHDFDSLDEKSERHFPAFAALRKPMYEESIRFFTDLFQRDGRVLDILDSDYTYVNESLAKHYGIEGVTGPEWRRVDGLKTKGRGGILGQASILAKQSGASRTSPILRGNWVAEVLLGDKLPRPPKDVPRLPEDETATEGLTVRQLVEKHSTDPRCAGCHVRIDPFGYALENFDAIGRFREKDLADRPVNVHAKTMEGAEFDGLDGLRNYLLTRRRDAFLRQFCRKLLGYSLGRSVQLSDEPLLAEMRSQLKANDYRVGVAIEQIVLSSQFRKIRGGDNTDED